MKFKVGDKVKVKKEYLNKKNLGNYYNIFDFTEILEISKISCKYGFIEAKFKNGENFSFLEKELKSAFPWKKFKKGKIVVNCKTMEEAKNFFKKAKKHGIRWSDKSELSNNNTMWRIHESNNCYKCDCTGINYGLVYAEYDYYKHGYNYDYYEHGYNKILEWSDYMNDKEVK